MHNCIWCFNDTYFQENKVHVVKLIRVLQLLTEGFNIKGKLVVFLLYTLHVIVLFYFILYRWLFKNIASSAYKWWKVNGFSVLVYFHFQEGCTPSLRKHIFLLLYSFWCTAWNSCLAFHYKNLFMERDKNIKWEIVSWSFSFSYNYFFKLKLSFHFYFPYSDSHLWNKPTNYVPNFYNEIIGNFKEP